jgi:hypothetical protein
MKTGLLFVSSIIIAALFILSSQIVAVNAAAKSVSPVDRLSIEQPRYSGEWKTSDLKVEYSYSKDQGQMDLSGNIRFANYLINGYSNLHNFHLGAIFLDENGKVLQEIGLATGRGPLDAISFHHKVNLPSNAAFMAFSYQGDATSGGGNGAGMTSFAFYPIH